MIKHEFGMEVNESWTQSWLGLDSELDFRSALSQVSCPSIRVFLIPQSSWVPLEVGYNMAPVIYNLHQKEGWSRMRQRRSQTTRWSQQSLASPQELWDICVPSELSLSEPKRLDLSPPLWSVTGHGLSPRVLGWGSLQLRQIFQGLTAD